MFLCFALILSMPVNLHAQETQNQSLTFPQFMQTYVAPVVETYGNPAVEALGLKMQKYEKALQELAPNIWQTMMKSEIVWGWSSFATFMLSLVLFIGWVILIYRKDESKNWQDNIAIVLGAIAILAFFIFMIGGLPRIINPESYAIDSAVDYLKSLIHGNVSCGN